MTRSLRAYSGIWQAKADVSVLPPCQSTSPLSEELARARLEAPDHERFEELARAVLVELARATFEAPARATFEAPDRAALEAPVNLDVSAALAPTDIIAAANQTQVRAPLQNVPHRSALQTPQMTAELQDLQVWSEVPAFQHINTLQHASVSAEALNLSLPPAQSAQNLQVPSAQAHAPGPESTLKSESTPPSLAPLPAKASLLAPSPSISTPTSQTQLLPWQRQKLGELLLAEMPAPVRGPLGRLMAGRAGLWREWAHQRLFALACASHVDLPEATLAALGRSWGWRHYRRHCRMLVKILSLYAGPRHRSSRWLTFSSCLPWLFAWQFERQLLRLRQAPSGKALKS